MRLQEPATRRIDEIVLLGSLGGVAARLCRCDLPVQLAAAFIPPHDVGRPVAGGRHDPAGLVGWDAVRSTEHPESTRTQATQGRRARSFGCVVRWRSHLVDAAVRRLGSAWPNDVPLEVVWLDSVTSLASSRA